MFTMKSNVNPEIIQALTPMFLAMIGCVIGVCALFLPSDSTGNNNRATAAMGLAGTAIAGAAGLAKNESYSGEKKSDSISATSPGSQVSK
jgi:hypothetical protein